MTIKKILKLSFACLLLCLTSSLYATNWVERIRSNSLDDRLQIVLDMADDPDFNVFVLSNPVRLVLDVKGRPAVEYVNNLSFNNRGVRLVRTGMQDNDQVRVVMDLAQDYHWQVYELSPEGKRGYRVVVDVYDHPNKNKGKKAKPSTQAVASVQSPSTAVDTQTLILESVGEPQKTDIAPVASVPSGAIVEKAPEKTVASKASVPAKTTVVAPAKTAPAKTVASSTKAPAKATPTKTAIAKTPSSTVAKAPKPATQVTKKATLASAKKPVKATSPSKPSRIEQAPLTETTAISAQKKEILVMIDPGHGGKDSGAVGAGKTREKDVVLQIAKRVKKKIDAMPRMRAVLTRSSDRYITLRGRLALAQKRKPDLFVSIHADAAGNRSASGASVYILSTSGASSKTAKWIAQRENAVDSKYGGDGSGYSADVGNILLGMQQDITIENSHALANKTLGRLKGIGKVHKRMVERAGFAVLKSPSIPSMLVETAFISNPSEERKLKSGSYQNKLAEAIASGIRNYFKSQSTRYQGVADKL